LKNNEIDKPKTIKSLRFTISAPRAAYADSEIAIYGERGSVNASRYVAFEGYCKIKRNAMTNRGKK
jgi:hypothetical protein